ncbi:hypothetical protein F0L74_27645 [Chitinophaga agrisoli]|uniref:Phosphoribosylpyrophosphate synthetase n=1 Tax=Chitinophaga agrisoli TaxID=2607653 RepID=A0A5B2VPE4_9BACT|nr:hypothetical protein [Chitinophaga agrisoli]KAA2239959.1 hypothetical protein F0L74_27645 [Chitinophaga agrisoli]
MSKIHYDTVSNAINALRQQGYTLDFNIEDNYVVCDSERLHLDDFAIDDVYRYEGNTDPADEAAVYAISSPKGVKGILVTGYGASSDPLTAGMLEKLRVK